MSTWIADYIAAWSAHDIAGVGGFMADDVDFEDVTLGAAFHSRKEVEDFGVKFGETFSSDYRFSLVTEFSTDTEYAGEWVVSGTHDRSSPELPATGQPFSIRGSSIGRRQNGKITYNRDYWDMATFLTQVGILPPST